MKAFVTGGTGFIGKQVVLKLLKRGYEVYALARSQAGLAELEAMGAHPVEGNINYPESMRSAMQGSDVVFHIAGWYKLGSRDREAGERVNVEGTRNVLELAISLGVPKIVYTSTVAVYGDTQGEYKTESDPIAGGETCLIEYDRTKWKAHKEVVLPLIEKGAPIIIVMPGGVYGPGDPSLVGDLMKAYYRGFFPVLPGPENTLTYAHVEDIAEGHLLAAEKGKLGESYILAGPAYSLDEIVQIYSRLSGKPGPLFNIPAKFVKPLAPVMAALEPILPIPALISRDALSITGATYLGRSDKAWHQLGWTPRPIEEGMRETLDWVAESSQGGIQLPDGRKILAAIAAGAALGLFLSRLFTRRRR
jgi:dihydroflavonol-4-reductase